MTFLTFDLLAAVIIRQVDAAPLFGAFHALTVNDCCWRTSIAPSHLPAFHRQYVVQATECAVVILAGEVVVQRAARRKGLLDRRPLASCAEDVHQAVDDLTHIDGPLVATPLGRWDQSSSQRPFFVSQVTRIAKLSAVVATAVLGGPPRRCPVNWIAVE